jgi:hypothetical protein
VSTVLAMINSAANSQFPGVMVGGDNSMKQKYLIFDFILQI